jgi:ribosomal protein S18 acetylase RimI-like enzyme
MSPFARYDPDGQRLPPLFPADGLSLRPAGPSDLPGIAALAADREGESLEKWRGIIERACREMQEGNALLLVAAKGDRTIGYGRVHHFSPPADSPPNVAPSGWYLSGVVVHPDYRRRSVGLQLTTVRLDWIRARSPTAYYFANARNQVSIRLHRRAGFVELTRDFYFPNARFEGGVGILFRAPLLQPAPPA